MVSCKARLKFVKGVTRQPNALDFQFVAFLFRRLKRRNFITSFLRIRDIPLYWTLLKVMEMISKCMRALRKIMQK